MNCPDPVTLSPAVAEQIAAVTPLTPGDLAVLKSIPPRRETLASLRALLEVSEINALTETNRADTADFLRTEAEEKAVQLQAALAIARHNLDLLSDIQEELGRANGVVGNQKALIVSFERAADRYLVELSTAKKQMELHVAACNAAVAETTYWKKRAVAAENGDA